MFGPSDGGVAGLDAWAVPEGVSVETEGGVSKGFDRVKSKCEL
eukprot:COSAG02_NODE_1372_length_13018_cov_5.358155_4_plen_43_part_00